MGRAMELDVDTVDRNDATNADDIDAGALTGSEATQVSRLVTRSNLQRETSALSENIIRIVTSGNWEGLLPNSGNSVEVGNHQVCVSCDVESSAEYRTWEWQGHILLYDEEEEMYVPEYVYGNYFEPLVKTDSVYENFLDRPPLGLTGIISSIERRLDQTN